MNETKLAPKANELAEESLEQVSGGTNVTITNTEETFSFQFAGDTQNGDILIHPDFKIK